jgi:hypothetical protein
VKKDANRQMIRFNPDYPLRKELLSLLKKALGTLTEKDRAMYLKPKLVPRVIRKD